MVVRNLKTQHVLGKAGFNHASCRGKSQRPYCLLPLLASYFIFCLIYIYGKIHWVSVPVYPPNQVAVLYEYLFLQRTPLSKQVT